MTAAHTWDCTLEIVTRREIEIEAESEPDAIMKAERLAKEEAPSDVDTVEVECTAIYAREEVGG